jgi:hypothetical protein
MVSSGLVDHITVDIHPLPVPGLDVERLETMNNGVIAMRVPAVVSKIVHDDLDYLLTFRVVQVLSQLKIRYSSVLPRISA